MKAHRTKSQAATVGLQEDWRRGNEIVDNIIRNLAEEPHEGKKGAEFKKAFAEGVKTVREGLRLLVRSRAWRVATRA